MLFPQNFVEKEQMLNKVKVDVELDKEPGHHLFVKQ